MSPAAKDAYGHLARLYDPATALFLDPVRRLVREALTGLGARRVLDACCGTGRLVALLTRAGFTAIGADASPAMLAMARRRNGRAPTLARMDVRRLAFPDANFDAAVICFALHENTEPDRLAMGRELIRVLRPGGALLLVDYAAGRSPLMRPFVTLAEWSAGTRHFQNYRDFLARKGVGAFALRLGRAVSAAHPCLGGQAALIVSRA